MIAQYVWRDLTRNPRRSVTAVAGLTLGVGLFSAILFFVDGSAASMTARATAPLPIDMQRVLSDALGNQVQLSEQISPGALRSGQVGHVELVVTNSGTQPANEVVVRDQPATPLSYRANSTTLDGQRLPDPGGDSPLAQGEAELGLNLGTVAPRTRVRIRYDVIAGDDVPSTSALPRQATLSSREDVVPKPANSSDPVSLADLTRRIGELPGVDRAEQLSFVDLAPGSLTTRGRANTAGLRVFGFDDRYRANDPTIRLVEGGYAKGQGLLSVEAARKLGVGPGEVVRLRVPGLDQPLAVPISGITDLSRAKSLFYSRQGRQLEQFAYVPDSLVVSPDVFADTIVASFQNAATRTGTILRSRPITEVDIWLQRDPLDADPAAAMGQTHAVAAAVNAIAPGRDDLIDNISNALEVAAADADTAKRMFVFLGLPGALLAAVLTSYTGGVLAAALRREQALLRTRGADRRTLLRMHALRTGLLAGVGSVLGVGLGLLSTLTVLPVEALARASRTSLIVSALIAAGAGFLAAGGALYVAGRGAISREISEERMLLASRRPWWARWWLDVVLLGAVALVVVRARQTGAFEGIAGSVYFGRPVTVRLLGVIIPLGLWIGGVWLLARLVERALAWVPLPRGSAFGGPLRGLLARSLRRRSWTAATAVIMVALIVALGTSVSVFSASYDQAKAEDSRFVLGADVRLTPSPVSSRSHPPDDAARLRVPDVETVTPVVFGPLNALVESETNEDAGNLAAIDPAAFARVAPLTDSDFTGTSAAGAMATLAQQPNGVFVGEELADILDVEPGDEIQVLFARATEKQRLTTMRVAGVFVRLPGFPEGANLLVNLRRAVALIPSINADFFLASTRDRRPSTLASAVAELRNGPGASDALQIDTRETVLDKDQSSLAALNIRALLTLNWAYALALAATAVSVFVFGLLLQRRREYVVLRAQGLRAGHVRSLVVAESGLIALLGVGIGTGVGLGMATFLVTVLRPLFVLPPVMATPPVNMSALGLLVLAVALVAALAASSLLDRLPPTELLRDE